MSEQNRKPLCKYFASNCCVRQDSCLFSHDRNARQNMTCTYYLAGNCSYGKNCRYDHIRPKQPTSNSQNNTNSTNVASTSASSSVKTTESGEKWVIPSCSDKYITPLLPSKKAWTVSSVARPQNLFEFTEIRDEAEAVMNYVVAAKDSANLPICPYFENGYCFNEFCEMIHGDLCEMCNINVLHPFNESQRLEHHRQCLAEHEKEMEAAFAQARSMGKMCGICMEDIMENDLRFGILQNCKHCFCLSCIRKWRQRSTEFTSKTTRSCPECRVISDYVIPSSTWVEEQNEKNRMITDYQTNMKKKECKYIKNGNIDDCPFGNKCFYKHLNPDGSLAEGEAPRSIQKRRRILQFHNGFLNESDEDPLMSEVINSIRNNN